MSAKFLNFPEELDRAGIDLLSITLISKCELFDASIGFINSVGNFLIIVFKCFLSAKSEISSTADDLRNNC